MRWGRRSLTLVLRRWLSRRRRGGRRLQALRRRCLRLSARSRLGLRRLAQEWLALRCLALGRLTLRLLKLRNLPRWRQALWRLILRLRILGHALWLLI